MELYCTSFFSGTRLWFETLSPCLKLCLKNRYCLRGERLDYSNETRLHMTPEEETSQLERINSHAQAEASQNRGGQVKPYSPHFICECYFMTLKGLHMGYIGCSKLFETLHRVGPSPSTNLYRHAFVRVQIAFHLKVTLRLRQVAFCSEGSYYCIADLYSCMALALWLPVKYQSSETSLVNLHESHVYVWGFWSIVVITLKRQLGDLAFHFELYESSRTENLLKKWGWHPLQSTLIVFCIRRLTFWSKWLLQQIHRLKQELAEMETQMQR